MSNPEPESRDDSDYFQAWDFVTKLPAEMIACRGGRSHDFIGGNQLFGDESYGIIHTETECGRGCGTIKIEDYDLARGYYVKTPHYKYKAPYLVKAKDDGPVHPTDLAAATRLIRYYAKKGIATPKLTRLRKKGKSA